MGSCSSGRQGGKEANTKMLRRQREEDRLSGREAEPRSQPRRMEQMLGEVGGEQRTAGASVFPESTGQ